MIQFNLLPDVKLEFVKAERTKHAVVSGAIIATGVAFVIFLLLFVAVHVVQKKIMSDQTATISKHTKELKNTPEINKILTNQNQLGVLPALHAGKPAASRTFALIQQLTTPKVSLTEVIVDYVEHTISITGVSHTLSDVNTVTDTMKYAEFKIDGADSKKAFSGVKLAEFSRDTEGGTFTIKADYDQAIFDNALSPVFTVPAGVSTPSVVGQPVFTKQNTEGNQ